MWVHVNSRIVPEDAASVSVFDRGFTYGDGIFETFRVYARKGFRLAAHLVRLEAAAHALDLDMPRSASQIEADVFHLLDRNGLEDAIVRINVSRGCGGRGPGTQGVGEPTYVVANWPVPDDLEVRRRRGARLCTVSTRRLHPSTLPPVAKLASYLNSVLAVTEAMKRGCDDGLMLTTEGALAECGVANIFCVRSGVLCTPSLELGVIPGITRAIVLNLALGAGLDTEEGIYPSRLPDDVSEVFVTNSVVGVQPVASLDGREYLVPGPCTERLMTAYRESVLRETGGHH